MSADNYIGIWKSSDGWYRGYNLFASNEDAQKKEPAWTTAVVCSSTLENVIYLASKEWTEYGVAVISVRDDKEESIISDAHVEKALEAWDSHHNDMLVTQLYCKPKIRKDAMRKVLESYVRPRD